MRRKTKQYFQRTIALLLSVLMLFSVADLSVFATGLSDETTYVENAEVTNEGEAEPLAVVYAASDFQPATGGKDDVDSGKNSMNAIVDKMQAAGYESIDGAIFCGDYSNVADTWNKDEIIVDMNNAGLKAVHDVLNEQWKLTDNNLDGIKPDKMVFVQGNHDPIETVGLDNAGANDTEYYGVYVLHEDDFQWKQGDDVSDKVSNSGNNSDIALDKTIATANALETYLLGKMKQKYEYPIFVASHVPLHYGYRTYSTSNQDNIYSKYIFDVLNKYGETLNIIFLFGHNHSSIYDDYIGGGAVYLPADSEILIPKVGLSSGFSKETLNFTYMNAGYLGYYGGKCATDLSSTVFEIYKDKVVAARYDSNGITNLKAAGVWTSEDGNWSSTNLANTTVYSSNQEITLKKEFKVDLDYGTLASGRVNIGQSGELAVSGIYGTSYSVEWSSDNESVATVTPFADDSMKATVTGVAKGNAKITATVTELTKTRAAGEVKSYDYNITVTEDTGSQDVTLVSAGTHTYFKKVNTLSKNKVYMLVDMENGMPETGIQMAVQYTGSLDADKEGDTQSDAYNEVNAERVETFQLPIGTEEMTLISESNQELWWEYKQCYTSNGNHFHNCKSTNYLIGVGEGDDNYNSTDIDHDRFRASNNCEQAGGKNWNWNSEIGIYTNTKYDGFQFVLYYDQAQLDFSTYRINHDGTSGSILTDGYYLVNETANSRIYLFEKQDIAVSNDITAKLDDVTGYVNKDAGYGAQTGDRIIINNGSKTMYIPVTVDMLSGNIDITRPGTYSGLTVTYAGVVLTNNYTLVVQDSATLLKNDAVREYMDTIYKLTDTMVVGKEYLIVDSKEEGIAHAMGVTDGAVTAHNVMIQSLPVDGKEGIYIDSSRYSDVADETAINLVGRGIEDQGDINAFLGTGTLASESAAYQEAISLVWATTQRYFTYDGSPEYYDVRLPDWLYLMSQVQESKNAQSKTRTNPSILSIGANAEDTQLKLLSDAYTSGNSSNESGTSSHWWWDQWKYEDTNGGVHIPPNQAKHAYLFYNSQNQHNNTTTAVDKNFQTEEAMVEDEYNVREYRRTWIYERVTDIDTISARISDLSGAVVEGRNASEVTGDYILVDTIHANGSVTTEQVAVTPSMLSIAEDKGPDLNKPGTYTNLKVTYQGVEITDKYTLVVNKMDDNYNPEFPEEGAVKIDKQLDTTKYNYKQTGTAAIDLSVTGIPVQPSLDLVIMLDASSSMQRCPHNAQKGEYCNECGTITSADSRMAVLEQTLENLLNDLKEPIHGYAPDIDVAIATFNGYTATNTDYELWYEGSKSDGGSNDLSHNSAQQLDEDRPDCAQILCEFTKLSEIESDRWNKEAGVEIDYNKGTNYDRAMEMVYDLLKAKQDQNAVKGENRNSVVVFMSDGAPYQFNYFHGDSEQVDWDAYLNAGLNASSTCVTKLSPAVKTVFDKYYNTEGKHWMAEAIKGDPNTKYKVIDPDAMTTDQITYVNGLGATTYVVGFGLYPDRSIQAETCKTVLQRMASKVGETPCYYDAADGDKLHEAFTRIAGEIRSAGNAVFTDQMGSQFDLITSNVLVDEANNQLIDLDEVGEAPSIVVKSYELYKRNEVDEVTITEAMVGKRKPVEPTIKEIVTFNDDGSEVYSTIDVDGDGKKDDNDNILESDGKVIHAANFWYNRDSVNAQNITLDNGEIVSLAPETFYWNVGDITEDELVLSYFVYLTNTLEGKREAGTYDTNNYAELNYTNVLGRDCTLSVPTPKLPWNQGTVAYAFYLVDSNGNPIINQTTGQTGSFEQAVKVTTPVYEDFMLNDTPTEVDACVEAEEVLPDGYVLYDAAAQYSVQQMSWGPGYYVIHKGDGKAETTYVVGVESTPVTGGTATGEQINTDNFQVANTIVWFAVVNNVACVPDTVVIDYGLPVEINVAANDTMMGSNGTVKYIGSTSVFEAGYNEAKKADSDLKLWEYLQDQTKVYPVSTPMFNTETLSGVHGTITILKDSTGNPSGKVEYTLSDTEMNQEETFAYATDYQGSSTKGYYYSTVTIIPATNIYYEDNFITYEGYKKIEGVWTLVSDLWKSVGEALDKTQAEDRPGEFSLSGLDANNIYGFDAAYKGMSEYSLGSARKVTVDENTQAYASFKFWGTGFDVISLTSAKTGTIIVNVYELNSDGTPNYSRVVDSRIVDTYYGYKYVDEDTDNDGEIDGWVVDPTAEDALYQVPVMKISNLPYDNYFAEITVQYDQAFDNQKQNQYDFYLDAIRIYDPANDGEGNSTIQDAYVADGEGWPSYTELRDLLITANEFNSMSADGGNNQIPGIIFIDGNETLDDEHASNDNYENKAPAISDYANYGPNNELYLAPGQSVAFNLQAGTWNEDGTFDASNIAGVHIGLKSVGGSGYGKIYDAQVNGGNIAGSLISTATELYYDITTLNGKTVVISNTGTANTDAILSITNLKVTYKTEPAQDVDLTSYLNITQQAAEVAVLSLRRMVVEEEPETFAPDIEVSLSEKEIKQGKKVTVTVKTSEDVEALSINGELVKKYRFDKKSGKRVWETKLKGEEAGELSVEIIAYDEEGNSSEPVVESVTVIGKTNGKPNKNNGAAQKVFENIFKTILKGWK